MKFLEKMSRYDGFKIDWRRLFIQSSAIMAVGITLAIASLLNPNIIILSARDFSWLPLSGVTILILGLLECLDAYFAKEQRDILHNLQVGALDLVVGGLLIMSFKGNVQQISMMIAAFLMVRGIVRITLVYALSLPFKLSASLGGLISIIGSLMVMNGWPVLEGWLISFCLNVEIATRGWAGISFALWIKQQKQT